MSSRTVIIAYRPDQGDGIVGTRNQVTMKLHRASIGPMRRVYDGGEGDSSPRPKMRQTHLALERKVVLLAGLQPQSGGGIKLRAERSEPRVG